MASLEAGRRLADRYVLKERLGDGGHAEVWAAADERAGGHQVALKFLHLRSCTAEEALPLLRHEARMAQRLDHPGVLRVEEPQRDGQYVFLPIEFAPGGGALRLRGAPWRRVLPVLLQVAGVLQHAHERGVVHRDIKPGNVLFSAGGLVRVSDFGTSTQLGSAEAPAAGSPFSASPQQLRDEPATPADDVYGLGALAYELLTRYPPFYPQFDAQRVQVEDPPPPVPVHPAPAALLDLVQAMLARDALARPSLESVVQEFERCLALPVAPGETDPLVMEAAAQAPAAAPLRRRVPAWWWLGGAVAAGVAVLMLLPGPESRSPVAALPSVTAPVASVADAVVLPADTTPAPEAAPAPSAAEAAPSTVTASLADEVRTGQQALAQLRPAQARAAFRRALVLEADNAEARAGLAAAARLEHQLEQMAAAARVEAAGQLTQARESYRLLLANQPDFAPARSALSRVEARIADGDFEVILGAAADAMRRGQVDEAESAYAEAAAIHPREVRVLDGQQRIAEIRRDRKNAEDLAAGTQLESAERWDEAVALYRRALERDANLQFAQDGLARSERRAALDRELSDYMERPQRLVAPAVRQAAQRALARGEASATGSPRLASQLAWLRGVLDAAKAPVQLELTSDNSTQVSVMQVGELGMFQMRRLTLPPGQYTIVGRREGFRDVRYVLELAPGQREMALSVRCTERI
ncbi:MAG: protein kinase [Pseudomonadota bacterium]|nr:protein kinase [Pseudomonadota bacterium]